MSVFTSSYVAPFWAKMQICTHTAVGFPNLLACWSNFCHALELGSVHDCTTKPPVPYGPHMRVPPTATYPCATFSAIEQPIKPIDFGEAAAVEPEAASACGASTGLTKTAIRHTTMAPSTVFTRFMNTSKMGIFVLTFTIDCSPSQLGR